MNKIPTEVTNLHPPTMEEWATALESGKYEQGTGFLQRDGKFCCLGVYADMAGVKWNPCLAREKDYTINEANYVAGLDPHLRKILKGKGLRVTDLTHLNDHGWSFGRIAGKIRLDTGLTTEDTYASV